ncbi:hypothetical protein ASG92_16905 [Arthrobacter sp. Soil736]|uniref:hypothetical protein n=1 Tax=Arthrobacter sp. Soil736 TaxID=1736395 RepID=UPI0007005D6A|nr:hypothetical protein [Arthrobacter sp. Soil736]KRE65659.1 hypothetical protein ASG92_16905 [Arthrobacter sp. Soil736]
MSPETFDSITLKIWDSSTMDRTLDEAVQELATRSKTSEYSIVVARSGPNTFTASLSHGFGNRQAN